MAVAFFFFYDPPFHHIFSNTTDRLEGPMTTMAAETSVLSKHPMKKKKPMGNGICH